MILIQSIIWLIILYVIFRIYKFIWIDLILKKISDDMVTHEGKVETSQTLQKYKKWARKIEVGFMLAIGFCCAVYVIWSI